jgi:hypothetical protein
VVSNASVTENDDFCLQGLALKEAELGETIGGDDNVGIEFFNKWQGGKSESSDFMAGIVEI